MSEDYIDFFSLTKLNVLPGVSILILILIISMFTKMDKKEALFVNQKKIIKEEKLSQKLMPNYLQIE